VPDAAAGLSEVTQRNADEAMVSRLEQHLLEQRTGRGLTLRQFLAGGLGLPQP
jgi:hypothetical protein